MFHQYDAEAQAERKEKQEKDFLLSFEELKRRAEAGNSSAQYLVGAALRDGTCGCVINIAEGNKWIELARNDENSPGGLCAQGVCYDLAIGGVIIKNRDKAKQCYDKAVEQGYIPALTLLGRVFREEAITTAVSKNRYNLYVSSIQKDAEKLATAIQLLTTSAESGYAPAIEQLAYCFRNGYGVNTDTEEALKLYRMAAEKGSAPAKRELASLYEGLALAENVQKNFLARTASGTHPYKLEARKWYLEAQAQGCDVTERLDRLPKSANSCNIL